MAVTGKQQQQQLTNRKYRMKTTHTQAQQPQQPKRRRRQPARVERVHPQRRQRKLEPPKREERNSEKGRRKIAALVCVLLSRSHVRTFRYRAVTESGAVCVSADPCRVARRGISTHTHTQTRASLKTRQTDWSGCPKLCRSAAPEFFGAGSEYNKQKKTNDITDYRHTPGACE